MDYVKALRSYGFKITPQRLRVIDYIMSMTPGHFRADDVFSEVHRREPTITKATVYNILRTLQASSVLKSFELKGATWFETNTDNHANFLCEVCGEISDIQIERNDISDQIRDMGYDVTESSFILKGKCPKCRVISS
jgi:Fe2+ or Zn2+ uptake regulation protein